MDLINGDCLEEMKNIETNSIDLLFCDLPYGQTDCKWDCLIDLDLFWKQVNRICKERTPMFFTCSTKFGVSLINSNPKNFRYDLVWIKSAPCGFLNAKKMPMKKHEMVYVFYKKLPLYDLSSHTHKFIKEVDKLKRRGETYDNTRKEKGLSIQGKYDPPLPTSIVKEETYITTTLYSDKKGEPRQVYRAEEGKYDPPLPNSILEVASQKGKHATQKPVALMEWCLKYYSKEGDKVLDPTMGSGSTGVACRNMNRQFIGIEQDEDIFKIAQSRLYFNISESL
jgi:DNA modification methylase